jgi:hypothetical protein
MITERSAVRPIDLSTRIKKTNAHACSFESGLLDRDHRSGLRRVSTIIQSVDCPAFHGKNRHMKQEA